MIVALCLLLLSTQTAYGGSFKRYGIGFILGDPTGISGHYQINETRGWDLALAYDLGDSSDVQVHLDHLWENLATILIDRSRIGVYGGFGAKLRFVNQAFKNLNNEDYYDYYLGVRAPLGLNYRFFKNQAMVFLETSVSLYLIESTDVDFDLGIGARLYFE